MATAAKKFRAGDTVRHKPTGETWHVAAVERGHVMPAGWPETIAFSDDCELVKAATDDEHEREVESWAANYRHIPHDCRAAANWRIVEARRAAECNQLMRC